MVTRPLRAGVVANTAAIVLAALASLSMSQASPGLVDVARLLAAGRYDEAESAARRRLDQLGPSGGSGLAIDDARDELVEALIANGRGELTTTVDVSVEALSLRESRVGPRDGSLITPLRHAAEIATLAEKFDQAAVYGRRCLELAELHFGAASREAAACLEQNGIAATSRGRYEEATNAFERSLVLAERASGPDSAQYLRSLEGLAFVLQRQGNYSASGPLIRRALSAREREDGDHQALTKTLGLFADQLWFEGDMAASRAASARALAIAEASLRPDHPAIAAALRDYSATLADLGDLERSRALKARALEIAQRNYGPAHPLTSEYTYGLGLSEMRAARYPEARRHVVNALKVFESRFGPSHEYVATALTVLAMIDARLGAYADARRELARAIAIHQAVGGQNHPFVALTLTELATVFNDEGRPREALPLLERALAIREKSLGPGHRDVARTLADLAGTVAALGQSVRAQALATQALGIWERLDEPTAPEYAIVLALFAELQQRRGDYAAARDYFAQAMSIRAQAFGEANPLYAEAQVGLAIAQAHLGDANAFGSAVSAEATGRDHLRLMLRSLPERQALQYATTRPRGLDLILSLAAAMPTAVPEAIDALIRSRALVLDEIAARRRVGRVPGDASDASWTAMTSARQRLANLQVRGPGAMAPAKYSAVVDAARQEAESAEQVVAEQSAEFRAERSRAQVGAEQVLSSLPAVGALVSFTLYNRTILGPPAAPATAARRASSRPVPSYLAFVLRPGRPVVAVPIGTAHTIDTLVSRWRADIAADTGIVADDAVPPSRASGEALRRRMWDPLAEAIGDARTILVVPDGALSLVPFAALPVGQRSYLLERGPVIHYLSAERDVVASPAGSAGARGLLAIGGPSFGDSTLVGSRPRLANPQDGVKPAPTVRGVAVPCVGFAAVTFQPLIGTRQEVRDLSGVWNAGKAEDERARVLVGREASETAFKGAAVGHRVLHLATHGFFLNEECGPLIGGTRGVGGLATGRARQSRGNPLLLSGLALAGANRRALAGPDEDDGILTAEEVASLDLSGVEWAVLSACDTGVGQIQAGEGVFGLRRAFQIAGARTVVMSLWSVDDQATRAWMKALYEGRFQRKLSTADSVHQASLTVLRDRRAKGLSTHPFFWAAFVAAGDWR
jgi:CHAT domain-containing protein/tetratricopeptide (TPR) repeat protein